MTYLAESWKRWLVWLVLVIVFATACVFLSEWQFERRAARVAEIELVQQNFDKPAVAIASVDLTANGLRCVLLVST
jgi:cytochrome oxidase assembly protein ShyY1